ncbi:hypothetical protein HKCCE2091_05250 [Rhodobacterales bacterium HKCCE2091]|nr:hypothetical protein [Rhodobacterales bacterium HKCCE2091]
MNRIKAFAADESGAITVDWVVLTAALVGLALAAFTVVADGLGSLTDEIALDVADNPVGPPFGPLAAATPTP